MIEVGNHPGGVGAVMLHSTESGQFLPCERVEFERLAAAIKRGEADPFLRMAETSFVADGDPDWTVPALRLSTLTGEPIVLVEPPRPVRAYRVDGRDYAPEDVIVIREP